MEPFELVTSGADIPVFCWKLKDSFALTSSFTLYDLARKLRERGWLVPAYPMPRDCQDLVVQRIVVKDGFSRDMAEILLEDIRRAVAYFKAQPNRFKTDEASHFHH